MLLHLSVRQVAKLLEEVRERCRELAAVLGEHLIFRGELLLGLGRLLLLRAQRIEVLFALFDGLGGGGLLCRLVRLGLRRFDGLFALLGEVGRCRLLQRPW